MEHYIYSLNVAKLLKATLVLVGFQSGPEKHLGRHEYFKAAQLLGLNFSLNLTYVKDLFKNLTFNTYRFEEVLRKSKAMNSGKEKMPCYSAIESDIGSCEGGWCPLTFPNYKFHEEVLWILRNNTARERCLRKQMGFKGSKSHSSVNVAWHIRSGDICLHCQSADYHSHLLDLLSSAVNGGGGHWGKRGDGLNVVFESQSPIPDLQAAFPNASFSSNSSLIASVCTFLTADILVTSGSSMPVVAAFAPPFSPLIFEERRKDNNPQSSAADKWQHHMFTVEEAILMENGRPVLPDEEVMVWVQSVLRLKGKYPLAHHPAHELT
jgi:hypothetical protein